MKSVTSKTKVTEFLRFDFCLVLGFVRSEPNDTRLGQDASTTLVYVVSTSRAADKSSIVSCPSAVRARWHIGPALREG